MSDNEHPKGALLFMLIFLMLSGVFTFYIGGFFERGEASLLLNLKLRPDRNHAVVSEALALGDNLLAEEFDDSHAISPCCKRRRSTLVR